MSGGLSPHSLSYPFHSLFIFIAESLFTLKYISTDFKMRGNKKIVNLCGASHHLAASPGDSQVQKCLPTGPCIPVNSCLLKT